MTPTQTTALASPYAGGEAARATRLLAEHLTGLGLVPARGEGVDPLDAMLNGIGGVTTT